MIRRPPRSTRTDTLFPYTTLFRSNAPTALAEPSFLHIGRKDVGYSLGSGPVQRLARREEQAPCRSREGRSEEHTSELQSLMRISYAVFCLKKKKQKQHNKVHMKSYEHKKISQIQHIKQKRTI